MSLALFLGKEIKMSRLLGDSNPCRFGFEVGDSSYFEGRQANEGPISRLHRSERREKKVSRQAKRFDESGIRTHALSDQNLSLAP